MSTFVIAAMSLRRRQGGMTLAEMMVALAVGLGVMLIAGRLLLLANDAYAAQVESAVVDDGGRYALELIGRAVHQAGALEPDQLVPAAAAVLDAAPARLAGLDAHSVARTTPALDAPQPDAANGSDVLAVRFPGDGNAVSCAGFAPAAGVEGWSIFHVARNGDGEPELRCKYRGGSGSWSADALVAGVDGFQVLYGVDTDEPRDGVPNRYVNADAIRALDAGLGGLAPEEFNRRTHWKRVVSVRVGLLLHGSRPTRSQPGTADYHLLGAAYAGSAGATGDHGNTLAEAAMPADLRRRERRLFTQTAALPAPLP
jgi:type IV pilus assembly protein PilW